MCNFLGNTPARTMSDIVESVHEQSPQEPNVLYTLGRIPQQVATPDEQQPTPTRNADNLE
jgi:hypothetical protein